MINEFFDGIRQIVNENEERLLKEVDERSESTKLMFDKKMEALDVHEQSIGLLHNMMNIHIEENIESKLQFLGECQERNAIIDKASKPIVQIKYPSPVTKLNQDRELENLIKEFKQKPKGKRRASVQTKPAPIPPKATLVQTKSVPIAKAIPVSKPAPVAKTIPVSKPAPGYKNTPSTTKVHESKENENLSKSVRHTKTKAVFDKPDILKSPQLNKSMKPERTRHGQAYKGSNSKGNNFKHCKNIFTIEIPNNNTINIEKANKVNNPNQSDSNLRSRDPPKVVQDALNKTKTDMKGTSEFMSDQKSE
jgi:hypothetical protein